MIVGPATVIAGDGADGAARVLSGTALRIVGAHVGAVGPWADLTRTFPGESRWDTANRIVLPGLVNGLVYPHGALAEGLAGYAELGQPVRALEEGLDADDLHVAALSALVQGLRHGVTTTFLACAPYGAEGRGLEAVARAAEAAKARACIAGLVSDAHGVDRGRTLLAENVALVEKAKKGWGDRLRALLGVGPLAETSGETLVAVAGAASAVGAGVYVRAGDGEADLRDARDRHGTTPLGRLERAGLLGPGTVVAPGRTLPEGDWERLVASGAAWVSTPREDIEEHGAALDYGALAARGAVPALGTGGLTPHLLGEGEMAYRTARLHGRPAGEGKRLAARALFERGPDLARRHFAPGLGGLEPGAPADLVVLDVYPSTPLGPENWTDHLVQSLATARVHSVMVAGELLLQEGRATVVDERELQKRARAAVHRLWPRVAP